MILYKDEATSMGCTYPLRSKSAADVAPAAKEFLADDGGGVKCCRTGNGADVAIEIFSRMFRHQAIRHESTEGNRTKHNGVVERRLGLFQESGLVACLEPPRLFPGELPGLYRYCVEAAIYMNDCRNITVATANASYKSLSKVMFWRLPLDKTPCLRQPIFRLVHRTHKSQPKTERCLYLKRGRNHPRDCVKLVTSSGQRATLRTSLERWRGRRSSRLR